MALDVDVPEPPSLRGPQATESYESVDQIDDAVHDDYRREELATFLAEGSWEVAFEEWAAHTLVTEAQFSVMVELGLLDELDFYWEPATDDVGFRAPSMPAERPASVASRVDADDVADIEEGLAELGRTVSEQLEADLARDSSELGFFAEEEADVRPGGEE